MICTIDQGWEFTNGKNHISHPHNRQTAIPMDSVSPWRPLKPSLYDTWQPRLTAVRGEPFPEEAKLRQIWDMTMISQEELNLGGGFKYFLFSSRTWGNDPIELGMNYVNYVGWFLKFTNDCDVVDFCRDEVAGSSNGSAHWQLFGKHIDWTLKKHNLQVPW